MIIVVSWRSEAGGLSARSLASLSPNSFVERRGRLVHQTSPNWTTVDQRKSQDWLFRGGRSGSKNVPIDMRTSGITVDASSAEPLYKQIFDQVVLRIRSRALPPGQRLPPTRALAEELETHRNTVVRAYADLETAGETCRGPPSEAMDGERPPSLSLNDDREKACPGARPDIGPLPGDGLRARDREAWFP